MTHKKSDNSTISSESYSLNAGSNLTSKTVDSHTTTFTYDDADQLLTEAWTGYAASYTYDANGNRSTKALNGAESLVNPSATLVHRVRDDQEHHLVGRFLAPPHFLGRTVGLVGVVL